MSRLVTAYNDYRRAMRRRFCYGCNRSVSGKTVAFISGKVICRDCKAKMSAAH